jgi:hypothetical protein
MDSPVFKSRNKSRPGSNNTSRSDRSFGASQPETDDGAVGPDTLVTKVKKAARVKPKARLSFGEDGEEVRRRILC